MVNGLVVKFSFDSDDSGHAKKFTEIYSSECILILCTILVIVNRNINIVVKNIIAYNWFDLCSLDISTSTSFKSNLITEFIYHYCCYSVNDLTAKN